MAKKIVIITLLIFFDLVIYTFHLNAYLSTNIIENKNLIEKIEFGQINWTKGVITIYGEKTLPQVIKNDKAGLIKKFPEKYTSNLPTARLTAQTKANQNARRNLYNALLNLRIRNDFYVNSYLTTHLTNDFRFHLNNFLSRKIISKNIYQKDSIKVRLKVKLFTDKGVISILTNSYTPELVPFHTRTNYENYVRKVIFTNGPVPQTYTSLVIDATELKGLKPALFPCIYDESRNEIYSSKILFKDKVIRKGTLTYIPDISLIGQYNFIDSNAFIIKAIRTTDTTDLVLPDEELRQFFSSEKTVRYLQNCNVVIIVGK